MNHDTIGRRICLGLAVLLAAGLAQPVAGSTDDDDYDDGVSYELRLELVAPLKKKANEIYEEKNEQGQRFQRASYSKKFHKVDDDTYRVSFTIDTASKERMKTERYLITLKKNGASWEVADRELKDTYEQLVREVPGEEKVYSFEKFELDAEGMHLRGTNGHIGVVYLLGKPVAFLLGADDLTYEYSPPVDLGYHREKVWEMVREEHDEDFVFDPQLMYLSCDYTTCDKFFNEAFSGVEESSMDDVYPPYRRWVENQVQEQIQQRKENPFSGFRQPLDPERRMYRFGIKKQGSEHWIGLDFDSEEAWEVGFWAGGYGTLYGYPSQISRDSGLAPYELEMRDDRDASWFNMTDLVGIVELAIDDPELMKASLNYKLVAKRPVRELPFYLNTGGGIGGGSISKRASITVNSVQTGDGEDLTWVRRGNSGGLVILPEEAPEGTVIELKMEFQTRGSIEKVSSSYSAMQRSGWLPFVQYTDKIENFDLTIKTPSKYKTLGIGSKLSEETEDGVTTSRWASSSAVHFPTIIFGDYLSDAPRTKATKFDGTEIPVTIHVDRVGMSDWGIRTKQLRPLAEQAVNALNLYREIYGMDYPYGKLDLVNDPRGFLYGQAPASIVYLGSAAFRSEATIASGQQNATDTAKFMSSLVAHEVAHQWWGSLVGNANFRSYWFVESLAEYSAALFIETTEGVDNPRKGRNAYLDHVGLWRKEILETDGLSSVETARVLWSNGGYRAAVYSRGPYAFHILRETFGDEKFFAFLKALGQELGYKDIVTRDIQTVAEKSFGGVDAQGSPYIVDLEWFFDQWIRGIGIPEYSFNYTYSQTEDGKYLVEGAIKQRVVAGTKKRPLEGVYYRGVVPVTVLGKDKNEYRPKLLIEGPETAFAFKVPSEPVEITLNKYGEILAHPALDNHSW